jgi:Glycosyl transferase family 2
VRFYADLASVYGGMAEAAADAEAAAVLRRSMRASLASAIIQRGRLARWWDEKVADRARAASLPRRIHHVHGPRSIRRDARDVLAVTTVRNGAFYVPSFLEHHRRLGVRHFLVLDNGSTDGTIELLSAQPDVTLYRTAVPYRTYENLMKRYMVRKYSKEKWSLFVDIDELFDYPASDRLDLRDLLGYLEHHGYTALVAQMLDMFSAEPLAQSPAKTDDLRATFPFFDLSDISKRPYEFDDRPGSKLESHHGGIRRTVFGSENGLTKAPLLFLDDEIETFVGWHHVRQARLADITGVLLHYPFNRTFYEKAEEAARSGRYGLGASHEYRAYWSVLANDPDLSLHRPTAQPYVDVDHLVQLRFLLVSRPYLDWVASHPSPAATGPAVSS